MISKLLTVFGLWLSLNRRSVQCVLHEVMHIYQIGWYAVHTVWKCEQGFPTTGYREGR